MGFLRRKKDSGSPSIASSYGEVTPSRETLAASQSLASSIDKEVDTEAHALPSARRAVTKIKSEGGTAPTVQVNVYAASPPPSRVSTNTARYASPIPQCKVCGLNGTREVTRSSNRKGNAGRKYWKCYPCNKFMMWDIDDPIGVNDTNPVCDCGKPSRADTSGMEKGRKIFFKCLDGKCDFFSFRKDDEGNVLPGVTEDVADVLRSMRIA